MMPAMDCLLNERSLTAMDRGKPNLRDFVQLLILFVYMMLEKIFAVGLGPAAGPGFYITVRLQFEAWHWPGHPPESSSAVWSGPFACGKRGFQGHPALFTQSASAGRCFQRVAQW
mmetsp:Transcript_41164/g.76522  ORF Transcript_41164/g.76522 Transcript_41164/m.76522 type:complete len:115 (+) Transcript_41164:24-368(+)